MTTPLDDSFRQAISLLRPLLEAEGERGNTGRLVDGDIRDPRPWWQMQRPLDLRALQTQFAFGPGITFRENQGGVVLFEGRLQLGPVFGIRGGEHDSGGARRRREAWWDHWNAAPAAPVPFENPFPPEGV